jgi:predicted nucleic acid-binding protein
VKNFLVDTNVILEWGKPQPSARVVDFVLNSRRQQLYTCTVSFAEICEGADSAESADLRDRLLKWLENDLRPFFLGRVLEVTEDVVVAAISLMVPSTRRRQSVHFADSLIAAIAHVHKLTILTRNAQDFVPLGVPVLNPWTGERFNGA